MAHAETRRIADELGRAVNGPAWHGPSILEALKGVSAEAASARPIRQAHSIWELVVHTTAWLEIVRQRVLGSAPKRITPVMNWPPVKGSTTRQWRADVARLRGAAQQLGTTIASLDDARLGDDLPGVDDTWSAYVTLHGVIQHVLYHAGQIAILKKGT